MKLSLRARFALLGSAGTAVALALTGIALLFEDYAVSRTTLFRRLSTVAKIVATNSSSAVLFDDPEAADSVLRTLRAEPHIVAATIYDNKNKIFARYSRDNEPPSEFCNPEMGHGAIFLNREAGGFLIVEQRVQLDSGESAGILCIRSDRVEVAERRKNYIMIVVSVLVVAWGVSYFVSEQLYGYAEALEIKVGERERELERTNKELESFNYFASHDLQAPIRQAMNWAGELMEEISTVASDDAKYYGERLQNRLIKARDLILALLALSRAGRKELVMEPIPLTPIVTEVIEELVDALPGQRIFEWWIQPNMPTILADLGLFRQVLENLISNAIKYSRDREIAHIAVTAARSNGEVSLTVTDDGCGYDMEYRDNQIKVWQPFRRLVGDSYEGHGCGLALVAQVVARHGGKVASEGWVDNGAKFTVTLQAHQEK